MTELHVTASPTYNKARRHYLRSTRNRPSDDAFGWTPFRAAEKKYKAKFPPLDLSDVLDLALLDDGREADMASSIWKGRADALEVTEIGLRNASEYSRHAYLVHVIPGLVILPGYLSPETQRRLIRWSLQDHARSPNQTNLETHYCIPPEGLWNMHVQSVAERDTQPSIIQPKSPDPGAVFQPQGPRQLISNTSASPETFAELSSQPKPPPAPSPTASPATATELLPKLRWANIGWFYHWGTKQYDFGQGKIEISEPIRSICINVVKSIVWEDVFENNLTADCLTDDDDWGQEGPNWRTWHSDYEPDAGIVNFYQLKDTLMGHVDRSEVCATSPLVSISLGNAAVFLIGGRTREVEPVPILLRSGDVVVMAGPRCRRAYHGIPRILEGSLPSHLQAAVGWDETWSTFRQYLETTRINVNMRQVFPKGFNPPERAHV